MDVDTYAWFYKQAKRVQRLEKAKRASDIKADGWYMHHEETTRKNKRLQELILELQKQIESHRKALSFYADEKNYEDIGIPTGDEPSVLPVTEDRGEIARQELECSE